MKDLFGLFYAAIMNGFRRPFRAPSSHRQRPHHARLQNPGKQRLAPAIVGGNWQGVPYLTYAEHDALKRMVLVGDYPSYETAKEAFFRHER